MAEPRSLLGSLSPWSASRSSTPLPKPKLPEPAAEKAWLPSGLDHAISFRPSPSLRRYPKDCPPIRARWFYAVDVAKRKPFAPEQPEDAAKEIKQPKKFVPFSVNDSQTIESAFQALDKSPKNDESHDAIATTSTKVPVNEDFLFDVHIEQRELEPAYWLGPVYEVRRGSWFYQDGSALRPCDENLANQLEEGYLKMIPWRKVDLGAPRAASQPRDRPKSEILEAAGMITKDSPIASERPEERAPRAATPEPAPSHRLFGSHMNTTVTYQDATVAYLTSDDFMSRVSSTVYGRLGGMAGTKVVRGYIEAGKPSEPAIKDPKHKSMNDGSSSDQEGGGEKKPARPRPSVLERQISSLAGLPTKDDSPAVDEEEEAREAEEKEMEASRDTEGEDQDRKIDHLILVTHGIGQRLGLRLDSINFVHDVNTMRKTMKAVHASSPDLQALQGNPKNCGVQILPICWRHLLDFPQQRRRQTRKEQDLAEPDKDNLDEAYPSLQDITLEGVPYVRALTSDIVLDVLLYQSAYREHIAKIVKKELERVLDLFKQRTGFNGTVSLCGHSLGSAILFDILCRQNPKEASSQPGTRRRVSSQTARDAAAQQQDLQLGFDCDNFFCLGSPIALFQMLKGRTISARPSDTVGPPLMSPLDPESMTVDPFSQHVEANDPTSSGVLSITASSPKCNNLYNIFHPTDPVAYRMEPLISQAMATLKPQELPFTKKGLFAAPGFGNIYDRVGQQVMSSWYNLTSGVASSLLNRSLGVTGDEKVIPLPQDKVRPGSTSGRPDSTSIQQTTSSIVGKQHASAVEQKQKSIANTAKTSTDTPTLIDTEIETLYAGFQKSLQRRQSDKSSSDDKITDDTQLTFDIERGQRLKREEAKVKALNSNGRVDYAIQEGMFDVSLLASIASHLSYWADEDVVHFITGQVLKRGRSGKSGREGSNSGDQDARSHG